MEKDESLKISLRFRLEGRFIRDIEYIQRIIDGTEGKDKDVALRILHSLEDALDLLDQIPENLNE